MAIIILLTAILGFSSCAPEKEGGFLRALDSPAEMKISGERNGVAFSAEIRIEEKSPEGERDGSMTFTAPASLSGISVSTAGGVWNCSLGDVELAGISAELLGAPLAVFMSRENAMSAEKITDSEGRALTLIIVNHTEGCIEFYIDSKSGYPVSVREKDGDGEVVMKFDITEYISLANCKTSFYN